ncbi:hypothetical protein RCL_jg13333.t1 [Rhizophagus clarus]|uniref:Uncharacterized protein n=1 Tax=Rhizophagus clarus TaxID=94130 RepID=A0A8H3LRV2_9GLOM|nr:hypothetical protein RCL_jg13333.t1 [Rhizophagus clarus]
MTNKRKNEINIYILCCKKDELISQDWSQRRSSRARTRDTATKERPAVNSFSPRSIMAFCNVRPWLLCTVIAHARRIGICKREQETPDLPVQKSGLL